MKIFALFMAIVLASSAFSAILPKLPNFRAQSLGPRFLGIKEFQEVHKKIYRNSGQIKYFKSLLGHDQQLVTFLKALLKYDLNSLEAYNEFPDISEFLGHFQATQAYREKSEFLSLLKEAKKNALKDISLIHEYERLNHISLVKSQHNQILYQYFWNLFQAYYLTQGKT